MRLKLAAFRSDPSDPTSAAHPSPFIQRDIGPLTNYTQIAYNMDMLFIETSIFTKRITESVCDEDYHKLQVYLAEHPDAGDLIRGSGGIRKIRCAASGRGKRGGARTLYYWDAPDKIYMIFCYLKNERENITPEQLKTLKKLVEENLK